MAPHDAALLRRWTHKRDAAAFRQLAERYAGLVYATAVRILSDTAAAEDVAQEVFLKLALQRSVDRSLPAWLHRVTTNACLDALKSNTRRHKRESEWAMTQRDTNAAGWRDAALNSNADAARESNTDREKALSNAGSGSNAQNPKRDTSTSSAEGPPDATSANNSETDNISGAAHASANDIPTNEIEWNDLRPHLDAAIEELPETHRAVIVGHFLHGQTHAQLARALNISRPAVTQRIARALDQLRAQLKQRGIAIAAAPLAALLTNNTTLAAPASLLTAIGKAALAANLTSATAGTIATTTAGISTGKMVIATLLVAASAATSLWWVQPDAPHEEHALAPAIITMPEANLPATETPVSMAQFAPAAERAEPSEETRSTPRRGRGAIVANVIDQYGNPADGAIIKADHITWDSDEPVPDDPLILHGETDDEGKYVFENLPAGRWAVRAWTTTGAESTDLRLDVAETETVELTLVDAAPTGGVVVNADGAPIEGAVVHVYQASRFPGQTFSSARATAARQHTDANGRFHFPMLYTGTWRFYIAAGGYAPLVTGWERAGDTNLRFVLTTGATVRGHAVRDETREPVARVTVRLDSVYPRDQFNATTNDEGQFTIDHVRPGEFDLVPRHDTLVLAHEPPLVRISDQYRSDGHFLRLTDGATITGRVYDAETGRGIAGARLYTSNLHGAPSKNVTTDSEGRYEFTGLAGGEQVLLLQEIRGYRIREQVQRFIVQPPEVRSGVDWELVKGLTIEGRVVDGEGHGIAGVQLSGANVQERSSRAEGLSNEQGDFVLAGFEFPGEVNIHAWKQGLPTKSMRLELPTEGIRNLQITLLGTGSIVGSVADGQGRPIEDAPVFARTEGKSSLITEARSDETGAFTLTGLEAGTWLLNAHRPDRTWFVHKGAMATVTLREGEEKIGVHLTIDLSGTTVTGRIVDGDGRPINSVEVNAWDNETPLETSTDDGGHFSLEGIKEHKLTLQFRHPRYSSLRISLNVSEDLGDIVLQDKGSVAGRVIDAQTGRPITDFQVMAESLTADQTGFQRVTGQTARFQIDGVDAGPVRVTARAAGYAETDVSAGVVTAGEVLDNVVVTLQPAARVEGVVLNPEGDGVHRARIYVDTFPQTYQRRESAVAETDASGSFELDTLSPDTSIIYAWHPRYAPGAATVLLRSDQIVQVEIHLPPGNAVEGRITRNGQPAGGSVTVEIGETHFNRATEHDGTYRIEGVPAGTGRIRAALSGQAIGFESYQSRELHIAEGAVTEVNFDFTPAEAAIEGIVIYNGAPVRAQVSATPEAAPDQVATTWTDEDGLFEIYSIVAGTALLRVSATIDSNLTSVAERTVHAAAGETVWVEINLQGARALSATISNLPPDHHGSIWVFPADTEPPTNYAEVRHLWDCCALAHVSTSGPAASIDGLQAGDYNLLALAVPSGSSGQQYWRNALHGWQSITVDGDGAINVTIEVD